MKKILFLLIMSVFLSAVCFADGTEVGTYTSLEGRIDVTRLEEDTASRVKKEEPVFLRDVIRTKSNSRAEVTFKDGTVLRLAPNSRVAIEEYDIKDGNKRQNATVRLYRGKMRAIVSKNGGTSNFHIVTPSAKGTVKGTDIVAFHQADKTGVFVKDGQISVYNPAYPDDVTKLSKGDFVTIPLSDIPDKPRPYVDAEFSAHEKDTKPSQMSRDTLEGKGVRKMKGLITSVQGEVRVYKHGNKKFRLAKIDEVLTEGDKVMTGPDGGVEITMENGNMLSLQANSEIFMKRIRHDPKTGEYENSFEADRGKIRAIVERLGKKSTFRVKTPSAVCGVRGTVMYLDITEGWTQAWYEGGQGDMTSLVSGDMVVLDPGQNSTANSAGNLGTPVYTTVKDRITLEEFWSQGVAMTNYSSGTGLRSPLATRPLPPGVLPPIGNLLPEDLPGGTIVGVPIATILGGLLPPPPPPEEAANFTGHFGYIGYEGESDLNFVMNSDSHVVGSLAFSVPGAGGMWAGFSPSGNDVHGLFIGKGLDRLWGCDNIAYTASDGGRMIGRTGGTMIGTRLKGKALGIYVDTTGHGGTFSALYEGDVSPGHFNSVGNFPVWFSPRSMVGITPDQLDSAPKETGDLYGGSGMGGFAGGLGGSVVCTDLSGETLSLQGERWGIWFMNGVGSFTPVTDDDWKLAIGGMHQDPGEGGSSPWLGTINGNEWNLGGMSGTMLGYFFDDDGEGVVHAGHIFHGDVVGDYCELSFTWEAVGGGEWFDVTDLLTEANLGFTISEFESFVSVPITEAYSSVLSGANANMSASMGINLYSNSLNNIWAGYIHGTHSGAITDTWSLTIDNASGHNVTLSGDQWSDGQWHALVSGNMPSENVNISGEAGGTYNDDNGTFHGVGGGTWSQGGELVME